MFILTVIALAALSVIFGLHIAWAAKLWWSISDEKHLARAVAGFPNIDKMPPPIACLAVAAALLFLILLLLVENFKTTQHPAVSVALVGAGLIFVGRGVVGFASVWSRITPEQPFRQLDLKYYSPLCLIIGAIVLLAALY